MPGVTEGDLKRNMLKMGIRSDDGYIYFNELLYRCMRRIYGNLKLNKNMQISELKTQYKIFMMTLLSQKKTKTMKNQEIFSNMLGKTNSVNPFLTVMFFKMSFKAWLNYCDKRIKQQNKEKARQ